MTALRRVCVAGLAGAWLVAGGAQEAAEEAETGEQEQQVAAPEAGSIAADETPDAGAADSGETIPEIAPLDELFVPSQNIRADEPVIFPVDF